MIIDLNICFHKLCKLEQLEIVFIRKKQKFDLKMAQTLL